MTTTNSSDEKINTHGFYCKMQYRPDKSPQRADIGVVLLVPSLGYLGACEDTNNTSVKRLFADKIADWKTFDLEKQAFVNRIVKDKNYFRSVEDLVRFSEDKSSNFTVTLPTACKVSKAPFLVLNSLFDNLIKEKEEKDEKASNSSNTTNTSTV